MQTLEPKQIEIILKHDLNDPNIRQWLPGQFTLFNGGVVCRRAQPAGPAWGKSRPVYSAARLEKDGWPQNRNPEAPFIDDPTSIVAVCVFLSRNARVVKRLMQALAGSDAGVYGILATPNKGVARVFFHIIANPNLRYGLLVGPDSAHHAGDALLCLHKNGISKNGRILGAKSERAFMSYLGKISNDHDPFHAGMYQGPAMLTRFRKQFEIIDLRHLHIDPLAVQLLTRMCIQQPSAPWRITIADSGKQHLLYDKGAFDPGGAIYQVVLPDQRIRGTCNDMRTGAYGKSMMENAAVYVNFIDDAFEQLVATCARDGMVDKSNNCRTMFKPQITIYSPEADFVSPDRFCAVLDLHDDDQSTRFISNYSFWQYLVPCVRVMYDPGKDHPEFTFPSFFETLHTFQYGAMEICAAGWWSLSKEEYRQISDAARQFVMVHMHARPNVTDLLNFYEYLNQMRPYQEGKVTNRLYELVLGAQEQRYADEFPDSRSEHEIGIGKDNAIYIRFFQNSHACFNVRGRRKILDAEAFPFNAAGASEVGKFLAAATGMTFDTLFFECDEFRTRPPFAEV